MDHDHSQHELEATPLEYLKFCGVILGIILLSYAVSTFGQTFSWQNFFPKFMGMFFLVFALFKFLDLLGFATSYIGYDVIAKRSITYAYIYPFIELAMALGYLFKIPYTEGVTLVFMAIGSIGVLRELMRHSNIKCACLGTYIKLPLTTVSLIEDVVMGIMALLMILKIF